MSFPHALGVHGIDQDKIEQVHPQFLREGLLYARTRTLQLYSEIKSRLQKGMNEIDARKLALQVASELGATKNWHQPYIRFGTGTTLSFKEPLKEENILCSDTAVSIDLGPVWFDQKTELEYEGDFGDSFVFGNNLEVEACIDWSRKLFLDAKENWKSGKLSGTEIYRFFERHCSKAGFRLGEDFDGHRLSDFPHHRYTQLRLIEASFVPSEGAWILELQVNDPNNRFGVFFEDLL